MYRGLRFDADAASAEAWSDALLARGALAVDLSDPAADSAAEAPVYGEPGLDEPLPWAVCRVSALFGQDADVDGALTAIAHEFGEPVPAGVLFTVPEQDWVRATQAQFGPIRITPGLWIIPSWCRPVDVAAVNLMLDPGLAFGTGSHPTTRLCLRWLATTLQKGASVLDYGCGSGVLAIAAARLGASAVTGLDVDPQALIASRENARRNGVSASFVAPDALDPGTLFDAVVANILANPLILLAGALARRVRPGGTVVLSGILSAQAEEVRAAYAGWFRIALWQEDDGWVALVGERT